MVFHPGISRSGSHRISFEVRGHKEVSGLDLYFLKEYEVVEKIIQFAISKFAKVCSDLIDTFWILCLVLSKGSCDLKAHTLKILFVFKALLGSNLANATVVHGPIWLSFESIFILFLV